MPLTTEHLKQITRVANTEDAGFTELVAIADLDPATAFRGATLAGNLRHQDLAGYDFTGAVFTPTCDVTNADFSLTVGVTPGMLAKAIGGGTVKQPSSWFWDNGKPPGWAEDWGHDAFGAWVTFRVPGADIVPKMRWCPQGSFNMGSADDDKDGYDDEKPRHRVTFGEGFWMCDTTVTEALWTAVTGEPPRRERGVDMPVTDVNWHEAKDFGERLNTRLPGLALGLPSEGMWEYACRAGTETPFSFGRQINKRQVRFGLGLDAGPSEVARLPANPWGLYEMHGNTWEWCDDNWVDNYRDAPADGKAWHDDGSAGRVVRGGCWDFVARLVRSACRDSFVPSDRNDFLGFRLARVRSGESGWDAERPSRRTV